MGRYTRTSISNAVVNNKNSVIFKKLFIWLDIEFSDNEFHLGQKLSSFLGQIGIFEGIETLSNHVINTYKSLDFNYFLLKEVEDVNLDIELNFIENFFDQKEYELVNVAKEELDVEFEDNDDDESVLDHEEEEDYYDVFFVPLVVIIYRNLEKKSDFYLGNQFRTKLYFKKNIIFLRSFYLYKKCIGKKFLYKIYFKTLSKNFKKFNLLKNNFFKLINNSNVFFRKIGLRFTHSFKKLKKKKLKRKKKLNMFKRIKLKQKIEKNIILKGFKWYNSLYILMFLNLKSIYSYSKYSHLNYINNIFTFFSQFFNIKSKFFKRYRRKKRLKKDLFRNFYGKKAKLIRTINEIEDYKVKKKRKN